MERVLNALKHSCDMFTSETKDRFEIQTGNVLCPKECNLKKHESPRSLNQSRSAIVR